MLAPVFYADQPPIQVDVHTGSLWSTWLPIAISLLALAVSGTQAYLSNRERKRAMPSVEMSAAYIEQMLMGDLTKPLKVISLSFQNRGREATNITSLEIFSSGGTIVTGFNMLLDDNGHPVAHEDRDEPLPGFGRRHLYVDASVIQGNEVLVVAGFGHGPQITVHAPMGRLNNHRPLSTWKQRKISRNW